VPVAVSPRLARLNRPASIRNARAASGALALIGALLAGPVGAEPVGAQSDGQQPQVSRAPTHLPAPDAPVHKPATKPIVALACTGQRFIGQRIACFSDRAVQAGDPMVCLRADSPDVRWPCVAKYAVVAGEAETCRLLTGPAAGEAGTREPAGTEPAETEPAETEPADTPATGAHSVAVDLCLSTLALVYHRADLCRELKTETMDDACLAKLVASGGDPALCREIESPQLREVCVPDPMAEVAE
jgi:hypothetical protein